MSCKSFVIASALAVTAASSAFAADMPVKAMKPVAPVPFFLVNDTSVSLSYQFTATNPGNSAKTGKRVIDVTHFDVWAYGTNFFNIEYLKSDSRDPAVCFGLTPGTRCDGAAEVYGFFRSTLGFNQVFNTTTFTYGPLKNVSFLFGGDANSENDANGAAKRSFVLGLQFDFDLPFKSTLALAPVFYKEYNHSAFAPGNGKTEFDETFRLEASFTLPLSYFWPNVPLVFSSIAGITADKGRACSNVVACPQTKPEYFTQQKLALDVGQLVGWRSNMFSVFGAYRYWDNKFGINRTFGTIGTLESTWIAGTTFAF